MSMTWPGVDLILILVFFGIALWGIDQIINSIK